MNKCFVKQFVYKSTLLHNVNLKLDIIANDIKQQNKSYCDKYK